MSMTLFDIKGEFFRLYELAVQNDDPECEEAFNNALDDLKTDLAGKSAGYVHVIKQLDMEADECDKVIEAFKAKKEARKNHIAKMKNALLDAMDAAQLTEIKAGEYTLKIAKNGGKQPLVLDSTVPDNYMKIKYEPDNDLIRTAIEEGKEINFAHLEERGRHLNIK
jgi:G:T/U-mismatch repair DNA glycosylase